MDIIKPHIVTIDTDQNISIKCPGIIVGDCRYYESCSICAKDYEKIMESFYKGGSLEFHGMDHHVRDYMMVVETDRCTFEEYPVKSELYTMLQINPYYGLIRPGRLEVVPVYNKYKDFELELFRGDS